MKLTDEPSPLKPTKGLACNGCGLCCILVPCLLAKIHLGQRTGRCVALEYEGGRFWCGIVRQPSKYLAHLPPEADAVIGKSALECLGNGSCDSEDEISDIVAAR